MACIFFGMGCSLLPLFIKVIVAKKFEINVRFVATIVGYAKMKLQKVTSKNRIIFGFFRCGGFWVVGWWFWRGCGVVFIAILPYHCIAVSLYCRITVLPFVWVFTREEDWSDTQISAYCKRDSWCRYWLLREECRSSAPAYRPSPIAARIRVLPAPVFLTGECWCPVLLGIMYAPANLCDGYASGSHVF